MNFKQDYEGKKTGREAAVGDPPVTHAKVLLAKKT
jgi:hypothetical protein